MTENENNREGSPDTEALIKEIRALREEIVRFNEQRFVRVLNSMPRMLWNALLRGMAVGLGTVVGASILVSMLLYFLSQIDFVPIIGDWAREISSVITEATGSEAIGEHNTTGR